MRFLLDSHILLWFLDDPDVQLSSEERDAIGAPDHDVVVSVVTLWELAIKGATGKLRLERPIRPQLIANDLIELPIRGSHTDCYHRLALHHRNPFDRMLVAQAIDEDLILITRDAALHDYPVQILGR